MAQPYVGEIRMFAGNFAPRQWALCNGQTLPISQYSALFSLIGTTYGGNGVSTFLLPNLQSRIPVGQGQGPGLTARVIGQTGGSEEVTITTTTMPAHSHMFMASKVAGTSANVSNLTTAQPAGNAKFYVHPAEGKNPPTPEQMSNMALQSQGVGLPHENLMPLVCLNYIIAMNGIFPSRN